MASGAREERAVKPTQEPDYEAFEDLDACDCPEQS
jgi:hypothetical protein